VAPYLSDGVARVGADRSSHHEDELVRLFRYRQIAELFDLLAGARLVKRLYPLALEDEAPPILPGHHVTPAFASRFAEVLDPRLPSPPHEPQAEALEVARRELLEGQGVRAACDRRLGVSGHGVSPLSSRWRRRRRSSAGLQVGVPGSDGAPSCAPRPSI